MARSTIYEQTKQNRKRIRAARKKLKDVETVQYLSRRHAPVVRCISQGMTLKETAEALGLTHATCKQYVSEARKTMLALNTSQLIYECQSRNFI